MQKDQILKANKDNYEKLYSTKQNFLEYPANWVIGFHNTYLKKNLPSGKVLDYGFGSGNNSVFLMKKGYDVYGTEVAESSITMLKENLKNWNLSNKIEEKFLVFPPDNISLPFADNYFDFILSNQVISYLPSEEHIKKVCGELKRVLKPGGVVFFTMVGHKNYLISKYTKNVSNKVHEVVLDGHRMSDFLQFIYVVDDENDLKNLFSDFTCLHVGHFDIDVMEGGNFHWIFIGKKE